MKKNTKPLIIMMLVLLIIIPIVSIKASSADVGEIYLNQNSVYGTDSSNIQFQYKAEKASSTHCSPVKGKIAPSKAQERPPLERNITPQIITQKTISNNQFQNKLDKDIKLKNITNYANNIGYIPFENGTQEITYNNGIKAIIVPMQLKNKSQENKAVFIVSVSQNDASNFPFIAKFEEENGTLLLTMFNDEGGIVIDVFNNSLKSSWALHHSCEYWTCVWYAIQYYLETPDGDICEHVCFHCSITLELVPFCSVCIGCIIGIGGAGLLNCAGDNCLFYPCQQDCTDQNYYGSYEYYCKGNDRWKHKWYYAYKCSSSTPTEGSCITDSSNSGWQDDTDTFVETCTYGCNEATNNCMGAVTCYDDPDCGDDGWVGSTSCSGGNVWQDWREYTCYNPGTENSYCDYDDTSTLKQICSSGDCVSGQCEESSSCEEYYPDYPWWCNENCWGCELGNEDRSICCPDSGDPDWCCMDVGPYCDSSTGECTVCGGDYPWECNDGCWGCPSGGDLCCPTSGDPDWCCYTEIGSVCMTDGSCCLPSTETCNNQDDDCDETIDSFSEGCGVGACAGGTRTCTSGSWGSCSTTGLATSETCNDVDDDCDGSVDESLSQECGTDVGACVKGTQTCSAGNWGACGGSYVGPTEDVCNGIDDNCNNITDEQNVCNNSIVINLEFPENNSVEYINSTPTFGYNITNVNYTSFNCSLWLDNGTHITYANDSVWINVGTSWNLTANRTIPDDTYYWWINCTDGVNSNISEKRIITINVIDDSPILSLISPSDDNISTTGNILFNCSATDDFDLDNITLYYNISGTWQQNETKTLTGTSDYRTFTINNIPHETFFIWNCLAYDNTSQSDWGDSNYTVRVDITVPSPTIGINLIYPTQDINMTQNQSFDFRTEVCCNNADCGEINVSLDPESEKVAYTPSTYTTCSNGICNKVLYSGTRFVFEDEQWKKIEEARSLKDKGFNAVYLEKDPDLIIDVIDFNYTSITYKTRVNENKINEQIPIRIYKQDSLFDINEWKEKNPNKELAWKDKVIKQSEKTNIFDTESEEFKETIPFGLDYYLEFGANSTVIILQDADTENLGDSYVRGQPDTEDTNYGNSESLKIMYRGVGYKRPERIFIMFDIASIPADSTIDNATLHLYLYNTNEWCYGGCPRYTTVYHLRNYTWDEANITFNNQPNASVNWTPEYSISQTDSIGWWNYTVYSAVKQDYNNGSNNNVSFLLRDWLEDYQGDSNPEITFASKEYLADATKRPYLNITYSEGEAEKGLIYITTGATPFYTNGTNPTNISLNQNQCQNITWWVNATGDINNSYTFFAYVNKTSNMGISNKIVGIF